MRIVMYVLAGLVALCAVLLFVAGAIHDNPVSAGIVIQAGVGATVLALGLMMWGALLGALRSIALALRPATPSRVAHTPDAHEG